MLQLSSPDLSGNESRYLQECITSTFVSSAGPFVSRFEEMVAEASGTATSVAVTSGTCGLHAALTAIGVCPGDLVVLPSYTFIASANAISHCGASPWLLDIDPKTWTLKTTQLKDVLATETKLMDGRLIHLASGRRVAAVMPVYSFGQPADINALAEVSRFYGLPIVADAAAALGAAYRGRKIAQTGADLTVYSFNGNKTITAGGGGAITGSDSDLLRAVRHLTTTAKIGPDYTHDQIGFNYRMTNLQAAVGCAQMERLDFLVGRRREIRAIYDEGLAGVPGLAPFPNVSWADSACWISGFVADDPARADAARQALLAANFRAVPFWKPMHLQIPYLECLRADLGVTDDLWYRIVPLPSAAHLSKDDQQRIISALCALGLVPSATED